MSLEKNLNNIQRIAKQKEDENWKFRAFLKGIDLSDEQIDALVHKLNEEVSRQIDCLECGNCCRKQSPLLLKKDINRLAKYLNKNQAELIAEYLVVDNKEHGYSFNRKSCPFLRGNTCMVYVKRPEDCRSYPHLHKKDFNHRTMQAVFNYEYCPIVFNVVEQLKLELWRRPRLFPRG